MGQDERQSLLDALTDHMAVYQGQSGKRQHQNPKKKKLLQWLKGLNLKQRQAAFTVVDRKWVALLLEMQRHLDSQGPCNFFVMPDLPNPTSSTSRKKMPAENSKNNTENSDLPGLIFRRSKGLLGRLTSQIKAGNMLSGNLMIFSSSDGDVTQQQRCLDSLTLSYDFLEEVDKVMGVLDELSYGEFLSEQGFLEGSPWPETRWLKHRGYYSLPAFVANRLEFSLWAAWASGLGTKQIPRSISKSSTRNAYEAAILASRICTKKQVFEDWWNKLNKEKQNRILGCVVAKVSRLKATEAVANPSRHVQLKTLTKHDLDYFTRNNTDRGKFSNLYRGLKFLEAMTDMGAFRFVDNAKWLGCTSLAYVHSPTECVLGLVRNFLVKVMNDHTERDLLENISSQKQAAVNKANKPQEKTRKSKHKKQKKNVTQKVAAPPRIEDESLPSSNMEATMAEVVKDVAPQASDFIPVKRKKRCKRGKQISLSDGGCSVTCPKPQSSATHSDANSEASTSKQQKETTSNVNQVIAASQEWPRTRFSGQDARPELHFDVRKERQPRPKAPLAYRPARRQNGQVENIMQRGILPKPGILSWDWPPIYHTGMTPIPPFGYSIRRKDEPVITFGSVPGTIKLTGDTELEETLLTRDADSDDFHGDSDGYRVSEGECERQDPRQFFDTDGYNQIFGGGVMYWDSADYTGMGYSRPGSHSSEDSSWARREADLTLVVDDIVGLSPPIAAPFASGASTLTCNSPSSSCSSSFPFDHIPGNGSFEEIQNGAPVASGNMDQDHSSTQPVLAPIIVRETKLPVQAPRLEFPRVQEARSPHVPRGRKDSVRWKRSPSPVLRCVPPAPPPPPPSPVSGVKKRRGFAARSGSSSPRHWGVVNWPDNADSRIKSLPPEGIISWRTRCMPNAPPLHPLAGALLRERLVAFSPLALEQEHPDVAFPIESSSLDKSKVQTGILTLHKEIEAFCLQVAAEKSLRKPFINAAVKKVTHALQVLWPRSRIKIFGSIATGLALPNSDVDLVVCLPPVRNLEPIKEAGILEGRNGIKETCLQHAARYLADQEWVKSDSLKTIENTAIPIIMLAAKYFPDNPLPINKPEEFQFSDKGKATDDEQERGPWGTNEDRHIVRLDISFETPSHTGLLTAELVKELVAQFPAISPLALVLKQFLMDRGLDHPYTGGLSSYCLVLLITRFLQHQHHLGRPSQNQSLGSLLMDFLHFFGCVFDPRRMCVSIRGGGMYINRDRLHGIDPLHIEDPLHPMNNVGRNCFRVLQCTKAFADAYSTLEKELSCYMDRTTTSVAKDYILLQKMLLSISGDQ